MFPIALLQVANVGPADWNFDETMSTLRYANRAKNIQNKPRVNEDPKDAMLREFQEEISRLRQALQVGRGRGAAACAELNHHIGLAAGPDGEERKQSQHVCVVGGEMHCAGTRGNVRADVATAAAITVRKQSCTCIQPQNTQHQVYLLFTATPAGLTPPHASACPAVSGGRRRPRRV